MKSKIASTAPVSNTREIAPQQLPTALPPREQLPTQEERSEQQIRELAFRLYEERGRVNGFAERDWSEAEAIIRERGKLAA